MEPSGAGMTTAVSSRFTCTAPALVCGRGVVLIAEIRSRLARDTSAEIDFGDLVSKYRESSNIRMTSTRRSGPTMLNVF